MCTLLLDNLPPFDPALFSVFGSLTTIRGLLSVTNNQNLFSLAFLTNVTLVVQVIGCRKALTAAGRWTRS